MADEKIVIDEPAEFVKRITLNKPQKRNAICNQMRAELFSALQTFDADDGTRVTIIRGAGKCFSSGYDLSSELQSDQPYYTAPGDGAWSRHVTEGWTSIWDLAKPVIAQVHGYALAGGSELAAACDLLYIADDASIGYPVVRILSCPDMQFHPWLMGMRNAMEMLLTGDSFTAQEAVQCGFANRAYPAAELEQAVLERAKTVAKIAPDLNQINKRSVHRAMEIMGIRTGLYSGSELMALATKQSSTQAFLEHAKESIKDVADKQK
ncbi:MAG: enoyl-CoA hydratase/isomerase family protein [Pseudomonadales bacterium]